MTIENRQASLLVGQQVPRVSSATNGINGQTINAPDAPVGLQLNITPRVNQDGLILMPLTIVNSSLGNVDAGIPVGFGANGESHSFTNH